MVSVWVWRFDYSVIAYYGPVLFAGWCLLSVSVVCNAAGGRAGRVGGRAADTARRASTVTSR